MSEQALLPTMGWPALVPGPVFLSFEIDGKPGHKGRHRSRMVFPKDGKPFVHHYADPETEAYEKVIAEYAALLMRVQHKTRTDRPVVLLVHAFLQVPKSWPQIEREQALAGLILPTSRPDGDNYLKAVSDALNEICYRDDSQVVDARIIKRYDERPAMRIEIREMIEPIQSSNSALTTTRDTP